MRTCGACGEKLPNGATQCAICLVAVPDEQDVDLSAETMIPPEWEGGADRLPATGYRLPATSYQLELMDIHIWSDIVCPWCYLGKRRFEHALALFDHRDEVQIRHRSFQLDPSRPRHETTNRRAMLKAKYQLTDNKVQEMDARMERLAEIEGLEYHLTDSGLTGNTLDAHQLLQLGKERGVQDAVIERLYRAYFTEQRSVFERDSLVALAGEAGLDDTEAREVLERDAYADAVAADVREARALGVSGVPFFVISGRYGVSGAQATEVFSEALARAWEDRATPS